MVTLTLISFLIIATYIGATIYKKGIPYSISETYYRLRYEYIFPFVMLATAFTLLLPALEASSENSQFLMFLSTIAMAVIGLAPNFIYGEKSERIAHYVASAALFLFTQIWVGCNFAPMLLCWIGYLAYIILNLKDTDLSLGLWNRFVSLKPLFWAEMIVVFITYVTVLIGLDL